MSEPLRDLDDRLGRLARTTPARVLGWLLVAAWVAYVALVLLGVLEA